MISPINDRPLPVALYASSNGKRTFYLTTFYPTASYLVTFRLHVKVRVGIRVGESVRVRVVVSVRVRVRVAVRMKK